MHTNRVAIVMVTVDRAICRWHPQVIGDGRSIIFCSHGHINYEYVRPVVQLHDQSCVLLWSLATTFFLLKTVRSHTGAGTILAFRSRRTANDTEQFSVVCWGLYQSEHFGHFRELAEMP